MRGLRSNFFSQGIIGGSKIFYKIHTSCGNSVLAVCDKELLGKTLKRGAIEFTVSEKFYGKEAITKEKLAELLQEFERLRQKPVLKARQVVIQGLDNDKHFSFQYLKSKRPTEFLIGKTQVEHSRQIEQVDATYKEDQELRREFKERLRANIRKRWNEREKLKESQKNNVDI